MPRFRRAISTPIFSKMNSVNFTRKKASLGLFVMTSHHFLLCNVFETSHHHTYTKGAPIRPKFCLQKYAGLRFPDLYNAIKDESCMLAPSRRRTYDCLWCLFSLNLGSSSAVKESSI